MSTALVVVAHPDDEVLGCGGTIARLAGEGWSVHIQVLADGEASRGVAGADSSDQRAIAARRCSAELAAKILGVRSVRFNTFPDNQMDSVPLLQVVKQIGLAVDELKPHTVFTHHRADVNIDHTVVHDAVLAACRPQPGVGLRELLFFEVPSSTEWRPPSSAAGFGPNVFVDIASTLDQKLRALQAYAAELRPFPHPRSLQAIEHLARWRGAIAGCDAAEAFELGRSIR
jgi:N-acetylglucosamine malate deacetylase 1